MYDQELIENLFGKDVLKYLKNKNRGGANNQKGNTYENVFTVYQIALQAKKVLETHQKVLVASQTLAFVDDLILDHTEEDFRQHHQLKNSPTVYWGTGNKSIADDFNKQHKINQELGIKSEIKLVLSSPELYVKLSVSIPDYIQSFTQVCHFYYETSLRILLLKESGLVEAIKYLCYTENPPKDKIEYVLKALLGAWEGCDKSNTSILEILKEAKNVSPSYIRCFTDNAQIDPQVELILAGIEGLKYINSRGFLILEYEELDYRELEYDCTTEAFKRFQQRVINSKPQTFDELVQLC